MNSVPMQCRRGEVYIANLNPVEGSEQGGIRPVVVIQNNTGNHYSPTTIVSPITSHIGKKFDLPVHVVCKSIYGLPYPSMVLTEQSRVISKSRMQRYVGYLTVEQMRLVSQTLKICFDLEAA